MDLADRIPGWQNRVETALGRWLPGEDVAPTRLHQAMRYAVLGGGKRVRPLLIYATGEALGVKLDQLDGAAAAVEIIHAYSLIHDDLPAMDDDDLRRGRPTCHRAFDEATAILAGDALQVLAFHILATDPSMIQDTGRRLKMIALLAEASGSYGMAGGQAIDLAAAGHRIAAAELEVMHRRKTGALIRASILLAAASAAGLDAGHLAALDRYGSCIGLAFQIQDDILDVEGATAVTGKSQGADAARAKPTYPSILGLEASRQASRSLRDDALQSVDVFGPSAAPLRWMAGYIVDRDS